MIESIKLRLLSKKNVAQRQRGAMYLMQFLKTREKTLQTKKANL